MRRCAACFRRRHEGQVVVRGVASADAIRCKMSRHFGVQERRPSPATPRADAAELMID